MSKKSPPNSNIISKFRLLTMNTSFNEKIRSMRLKYGIPEEGFKSHDEYLKNRGPKETDVVYRRELTVLRRKCTNFSPIYENLFNHYFLYNQIDGAPFSLSSFEFKGIKLYDLEEEQQCFIPIYPESNRDDIINAYNSYKLYLDFKGLSYIDRKGKDLERDIMITEMLRAGSYTMDIEEVINKTFPHNKIEKGEKVDKYIKERASEIEKQAEILYLEE